MRLPTPFRDGAARGTDGSGRSLCDDERGIEGLPIRLVIALVVGVACLSVMMGMISGVGGIGTSELDAQPEPDVIDVDDESSGGDVTITVVDDEGATVAGATVVLRGETAQLDNGTRHEQTGDDGSVTFSNVDPELGLNQQQGTLSIDVQPPASSEYEDQRANTDIMVIGG